MGKSASAMKGKPMKGKAAKGKPMKAKDSVRTGKFTRSVQDMGKAKKAVVLIF